MAVILTEEQLMLRESAQTFLADQSPVSRMRELRDAYDEEWAVHLLEAARKSRPERFRRWFDAAQRKLDFEVITDASVKPCYIGDAVRIRQIRELKQARVCAVEPCKDCFCRLRGQHQPRHYEQQTLSM